ncbi:hypothetical protein L6452_40430 [Arctium lappa]|uniref:Uncharacterized protein n=1 Tax=Arctium lappa TaxID=4217 RepID=A0ACB8XLC6_ARCLA|nr:hypothetical protein L6452_40430 [Arctium lappa]
MIDSFASLEDEVQNLKASTSTSPDNDKDGEKNTVNESAAVVGELVVPENAPPREQEEPITDEVIEEDDVSFTHFVHSISSTTINASIEPARIDKDVEAEEEEDDEDDTIDNSDKDLDGSDDNDDDDDGWFIDQPIKPPPSKGVVIK